MGIFSLKGDPKNQKEGLMNRRHFLKGARPESVRTPIRPTEPRELRAAFVHNAETVMLICQVTKRQ
jgi:hypothetical protein